MVFSTTSNPRRPTRQGELRSQPVPAPWRTSETGWRGASDLVRRESPRRLLWLPVALAVGIGWYFALPAEPPAWMGPGGALAALGTALSLRRWTVPAWGALLVVAMCIGFSAAELRTRTQATVMLDRELWAELEGRVAAIERRPSDWRLTLHQIRLSGDAAGERSPSGARIAVAMRLVQSSGSAIGIGDSVRMRVRLRPPSAPVAPGAFDFQRDAFFRGFGAVGFAVGPVSVVSRGSARWDGEAWEAVDRLRDVVARRIRSALPDPAGSIAAAMLVGDRAGIDEPTAAAFRQTGLAHLLAISGLHMGLVAGTVFAVVRLALAACPTIALRRPIKKWAAAAALATAAFYLLLAGAPVPTQRAFLMTGLVLCAVLLDREAVSLHMVAWAAAAVLLIAPESLIGPSFQLSFAAVTALVAVWEGVSGRRSLRGSRRFGAVRHAMRYLFGVVATSVVASLVTAPIVAHHFQQVPILGAIANVMAVPVTAFVTMPAGIASLIVMPIGLEAWPLAAMGWGIEATLWAAAAAIDGPLTAIGVTALGTAPLAVLAVGGLWLAIWRTAIRWVGVMIAGVAAIVIGLERPPDALISADGKLSAVHVDGTGWLVSRENGGGFVRKAWQRRWGGSPDSSFLATDLAEASERFACDGLGCVVRINGRVLTVPTTPEAAIEDCDHADIIVTGVHFRRGCPSNAIVIDRSDLRRNGTHAIWLSAGGVRIRSVAAERGHRPWVTAH
ncbi:ComEC/Rec2 family competence protein [Thalassobaculum sp.]|uniref:ComEC/Rec2 family competence protein n=1 Tax=Thalassobaculum sp. TaxID=2022740 RepID=UPI0032EE13D9